MYGVLSLKETLEIEVLGMKQEVKLCWYRGQIGAMPIFEKYEDALDYVDGNNDRVFPLKLVEKDK